MTHSIIARIRAPVALFCRPMSIDAEVRLTIWLAAANIGLHYS